MFIYNKWNFNFVFTDCIEFFLKSKDFDVFFMNGILIVFFGMDFFLNKFLCFRKFFDVFF